MIPSPDYIIGILIDANFTLDQLDRPDQVAGQRIPIKSLNEVTSELKYQSEVLKQQVSEGEAPDLQDRDKESILSAIEAIKQHEKSEVLRTTDIAVRQFWTSLKTFEKEISRIKSVNKVKKVKNKVTKTEKGTMDGK